MIVRRGQIEDMPAVLDLIRELAVFENEPDAVEVTVADLEKDGFGDNPLFNTFVAEVPSTPSTGSGTSSTIVGMALYYNRYSTWKGQTIHLEDLIVTESMRGKGVGSALYTEIMKQAQKDNVRRVEWAVLDWNTPAIEFYEKSGANVLKEWCVAQMDKNGIENFLSKL